MNARISALPFGELYSLYLAKVERKGRTQQELDLVLGWFFGLPPEELAQLHPLTLAEVTEKYQLSPGANQITGSVCGVNVATVTDPFMAKVRRMDKVVDDLARGKQLNRIITTG